jgi:integrase
MAQQGSVWRKGGSWFLRYRDDFQVDGKLIRKQVCVKLAAYCDRYRCESDLDDLVAEKMAGVRQASKCPHSSDLFNDYVRDVYLPFVLRTMAPSTYAGYRTYFERYVAPRTERRALRDFSVSIVAGLLKDITAMHKLNRDTVTKIRSVLSAVFTYAMSEGHFPARSAADNPAGKARIPETASKPKPTVAATRKEVQATLAALKEMPLERAAVGLIALTGTRPSEARGLRWEEWNRAEQHIAVNRGVWHRIVGDTKTPQSIRFVTVTAELREILLALWKVQGSPIAGYILAGPKGQPVILDNLAKRSIRWQLEKVNKKENSHLTWPGWYALRRFHGTAVRTESNLETTSKALGNSKAVADRHYVKPKAVLPDVRKAVNDALSGLIQ